MKSLKQLLTERKYLEAKTLALEDRENLEESIDVMLEAIEHNIKAKEFTVYINDLDPKQHERTYWPLPAIDSKNLEKLREAAETGVKLESHRIEAHNWSAEIHGEKWVEHPEGGMCKESSLSKGYKPEEYTISFDGEIAKGFVGDGYTIGTPVYLSPRPITDIKVTCSFNTDEPEDLDKPSELEEA